MFTLPRKHSKRGPLPKAGRPSSEPLPSFHKEVERHFSRQSRVSHQSLSRTTRHIEEVILLATDQQYTAAAQAVAAGNATPAQVSLNNKMASQARFGNPLVQQAQDAQKKAAKKR